MNNRVLLGMSGGVDSSVSAILLKEQGYEVVGSTMKLWSPNNNMEKEKAEESIRDAKKVCEKLGIEHHVIDCKEDFKCHVIKNFIDEYKEASTPNPCIECNKYLKFGKFYDLAEELNCNYIATGHYAKIEYSNKHKQYVLKKAEEIKKDQTYFLYSISKEKLPHILFPLQNYTNKEDTRNIAEKAGLKIAKKKDSQEICFIPNNNYQEFLVKYIDKVRPGNIVLRNGEILGKHNGIINYTIGQRKGLGISYKEPLYVIELNIEKNEVIVGTEKELYKDILYADNLNFIIDAGEEFECYAKIRYRAKEAKAKVVITEGKAKVKFEEQQRAITRGQSVVFYDNEGIVIGGGKIL